MKLKSLLESEKLIAMSVIALTLSALGWFMSILPMIVIKVLLIGGLVGAVMSLFGRKKLM